MSELKENYLDSKVYVAVERLVNLGDFENVKITFAEQIVPEDGESPREAKRRLYREQAQDLDAIANRIKGKDEN